jgi:hypothetical protein
MACAAGTRGPQGGGPLDPRALEPQDYGDRLKERGSARAAAPSKRSPRAWWAHGPGVDRLPPPSSASWPTTAGGGPLCALVLSAIGMPRAGATRDGEGAVARRAGIGFGTGRSAPRFLLVGSTLVHLGQPALDAAG